MIVLAVRRSSGRPGQQVAPLAGAEMGQQRLAQRRAVRRDQAADDRREDQAGRGLLSAQVEDLPLMQDGEVGIRREGLGQLPQCRLGPLVHVQVLEDGVAALQQFQAEAEALVRPAFEIPEPLQRAEGGIQAPGADAQPARDLRGAQGRRRGLEEVQDGQGPRQGGGIIARGSGPIGHGPSGRTVRRRKQAFARSAVPLSEDCRIRQRREPPNAVDDSPPPRLAMRAGTA